MERLFRSFKAVWLPRLGYRNLSEAMRNVSYYMMDYYNWQRLHQFNDGCPPAKAEYLSRTKGSATDRSPRNFVNIKHQGGPQSVSACSGKRCPTQFVLVLASGL